MPNRSAHSRILAAVLLCATILLCAATPSAAKAPRDFFGASAVRPSDRDFAGMGRLGLGTARVELSWRLIQKQRGGGNFNWHSADVRFRQATENGLTVLPMLFGTPEFIDRDRSKIKPPVRSKRNRLEWRRFVRAAVARYGPGGAFWRGSGSTPLLPGLGGSEPADDSLAPTRWIIWNEPNARPFWRPEARPREYAALIRNARRATRDLEPRPRLFTGGMFGQPRHSRSMRMKPFLKRLYRQRGIKQALAGVALHPYAANVKGVRKQVRTARRVMNRAGQRGAGIIVSEIGWASAGPKRNFLVKDQRRQARLLERANRLLLRKRQQWRIRSSMWFVWRNYGRDPNCPWCSKAGLVKKDFTPKPAYRAYRGLINRQVRD